MTRACELRRGARAGSLGAQPHFSCAVSRTRLTAGLFEMRARSRLELNICCALRSSCSFVLLLCGAGLPWAPRVWVRPVSRAGACLSTVRPQTLETTDYADHGTASRTPWYENRQSRRSTRVPYKLQTIRRAPCFKCVTFLYTRQASWTWCLVAHGVMRGDRCVSGFIHNSHAIERFQAVSNLYKA